MGMFEKAQKFVSRWEGGFVNDSADPGGATNFGISLRFLRTQGLDMGDIDGDGDVDADDIRRLTAKDAAAVMRREFWDSMGLDDLNRPLCAMVLYDTAVNMGPGYARRLLQKALGVRVDGAWGVVTRASVRTCDDRKTAVAMCHIRRARYHELVRNNAALGVFLKGWLRRVDALERAVEQ